MAGLQHRRRALGTLLLLLLLPRASIGEAPGVTERPQLPAQAVCDTDLVASTLQIVDTFVASHLHLVFEEQQVECMVTAAMRGGVVVIAADEAQWWQQVQLLSYRQASQHVLVGRLSWITSLMAKVKRLYTSAKISARRTRWVWVLDQRHEVSSAGERVGAPNAMGLSDAPQSFSSALDAMSEVLVEGVRGVLLARARRLRRELISREGETSVRERRRTLEAQQVLLGAVVASGSSRSWRLEKAGEWTPSGLQLVRPVWPKPSYNLRRRVVRLACARKPMVFEYEAAAQGLAGAQGYGADLMRLLQARLNFSSVILPVSGFGSVMKNGSWNGMVGELSRLKADMSPLDFSPSAERSQVLDFGLTYSLDGVVILGEAPALVPRPFLLLNIFSPYMWACLVVMAWCAGAAVAVLEGVGGRVSGRTRRPLNCLTSVFKIFVYQSSRWWPGGGGGRVVSGVVMVAALVVGSLYSGFVTAFLAIPVWSVPVNSAEELAATSTVPAFRARTTMYNFIIAQRSGALGELRARMKTVESEVLNSWSFLSQVADGTYALLDTHSSAVGRAQQYEQQGEQCKFHVARQLVRMDLDAFAFARNSFLIHQFDVIMRRLRYGGIIKYMQDQYFQLPCQTTKSRSGPQAMALKQVQAAFYVLGVGEAVALAVLLCELFLPVAAARRRDAPSGMKPLKHPTYWSS